MEKRLQSYNEQQAQQDIQTSHITEEQYTGTSTQVSDLQEQILEKEQMLQQKEYELEQYKNYTKKQDDEINDLKQKVRMLNVELNDLKVLYANATGQINAMNNKLEYAEPIIERYQRGINLKKYHILLGDYDDYVQPLVLEYLGLQEPKTPETEQALWERGKKIYDWISARYTYCGDRGLRFGSSYTQFQFFSPDELLSVDNNWCGDCDDFATLFAGMMYASGVKHEDVMVVCGETDGGGHCWNWFSVGGKIRTVDGVCTQSKSVIDVLGHRLWEKDNYNYPDSFSDVGCFDTYRPFFAMTPDKFAKLNVSYE